KGRFSRHGCSSHPWRFSSVAAPSRIRAERAGPIHADSRREGRAPWPVLRSKTMLLQQGLHMGSIHLATPGQLGHDTADCLQPAFEEIALGLIARMALGFAER